jgi:hypothetical protein
MSSTELTAETEATLTISFQRTISVKQYEPVQAFGALKFGATTPPEQIELLIGRFNELAGTLALEVTTLAQAQADRLRGGAEAPVEAAPSRTAYRKPQALPAGGGFLMVEGRSFESYTNRENQPAFKTTCEACGAPVYINGSVGKNGVVYSARQNIDSKLKFQGGLFCKDHAPKWGAPVQRRAAPVAQVAEDDDDNIPF